jgi:hypothetical protein
MDPAARSPILVLVRDFLACVRTYFEHSNRGMNQSRLARPVRSVRKSVRLTHSSRSCFFRTDGMAAGQMTGGEGMKNGFYVVLPSVSAFPVHVSFVRLSFVFV